MKLRGFCRLAILLVMFVLPCDGAERKGALAVLQNASRLGLSPNQKSEIQGIVRRTVREFNQVRQTERGKPGLSAKLDRIREASQQQALKLLTATQRKQWERIGSSRTQTQDPGGAKSLIIPTIEEMRNPPRPGAFGSTTGIMETKPHPPIGEDYVILTDHRDVGVRRALQRLSQHRNGSVIAVSSLGELFKRDAEFARLQDSLRELKPRFVAIAPMVESYRENLHLCILKLLTGLDDDPELDAFPGYLLASDPDGVAALVERTIRYRPLEENEISPVSIGAIEDTDARRYRSYQKAKVIQRMFADDGTESPAIIITTRKSHTERDDFPKLDGNNIAMLPGAERFTFGALSAPAAKALNRNNVLFMFGHGTVERIVGTRIGAFAEIDFQNELVFCGSCYSAAAYRADRHDLGDKQGKRFAFHAMDNGAVMMLGHMGLCGGFPVVYPMAEHVLDGLSAGEAYQRIMNARIAGKPIPDYYPEPPPKKADRGSKANGLLYVLLGDPALKPIRN